MHKRKPGISMKESRSHTHERIHHEVPNPDMESEFGKSPVVSGRIESQDMAFLYNSLLL
jgi:hypothetical protein